MVIVTLILKRGFNLFVFNESSLSIFKYHDLSNIGDFRNALNNASIYADHGLSNLRDFRNVLNNASIYADHGLSDINMY